MRDGVHIRLTLTRGVKITSGMDPRLNRPGPTLIVLAEHKPPVYDSNGLTLITSSLRRFPPDCLDPKIHHCNLIQSILAKIQANAAGADDALMLDRAASSPRPTPRTSSWSRAACVAHADAGGLPGGDHARGRAGALPRARHPARGRRPVAGGVLPGRRGVLHRHDGRARPRDEVDGRPIGDGAIGPMTRRLSGLFAERTATDGMRVVD